MTNLEILKYAKAEALRKLEYEESFLKSNPESKLAKARTANARTKVNWITDLIIGEEAKER